LWNTSVVQNGRPHSKPHDDDDDDDDNNVPKSVETSQVGKVTILWNQQVQTDRTIPNSKPDIIIRDNEKATCMLIDVAIPGDRNVIKKEAEKILKYKGLITETQRTRNVKTKVKPVTIGATGTISKSFRKYLSRVPGKTRYQGTAENSRTGHSTHTAGSVNVEAQKGLILQTALYAPLTVRAE
jgi:hypothetical protein